MANVFYGTRIVAEVQKRLYAAVPTLTAIFDYVPLEENLDLDWAATEWVSASKGASSSVNYRASHAVDVTIRRAWPDDGNLTQFKDDTMNAVYAALVTGYRFSDAGGNIGDIHDISSVVFKKIGQDQNRTVEFSFTFELQTEANKRT
ncbi:MAG: hypothetical protein JST51_01490 [Armatimonadetes bacterium]|nr:hypothetical protein [Armatimonadota bacterium]